ncbi:MAG TPA: helix-turn-helix transcriptional regulator [Anaerohalosphaeraceae bacterium]|jgi:transcriptional regulator with XRE-family HTH domain|nr:helix-turn-helix transcriptional regulator [Anaerohalosphaeraceae bacterium]
MQKSIYSKDQEQLQNLLRELRKQKGYKQKDLAALLKTPQSFVSKYEVGERRLDILEIRRICLVLGISLSNFVKELEARIREAE